MSYPHPLYIELGLKDDDVGVLLERYNRAIGTAQQTSPPSAEEDALYAKMVNTLLLPHRQIVIQLFSFKMEQLSCRAGKGERPSLPQLPFPEETIVQLRAIVEHFKENRDVLSYVVHLIQFRLETDMFQTGP